MAIKIFFLFFCLGLVAVLGGIGKQPQFAQARFANRIEKIRLCYAAKKQLREKRLDRVCLYCGSYSQWQMWGPIPALQILLTGKSPSIFIPSANKGIDIIGVTGSGKTFSALDPLCASAIEQGLALFVYDAKGKERGEEGQIPFLATHALRHGYNVRIFAPGRDYSCVINPLDFMRDPQDTSAAETLATNFHDNLRGESQRKDGFFAPAAQRILVGSFMIAKGTKYPDLAMAFSIIKLPKLAERLAYAAKQNNEYYDLWIQIIFSQLVALIESDRAMANVMASADDVIANFMRPDIVPCLIGATNVSLRLEEKDLLILQSDTKRITVVNPILASVTGLSIGENFGKARSIPIVYSFDEVSTFKVKGAPDWVNIFRSQGYASIYGAQSIEQYYNMYGKDKAAILRNTCGTRMWFNPGSTQTAKVFSEYLGKKLITLKNKSVSYSRAGRTVTTSEQKKEVDLVEIRDWLGYREGELVCINPHIETAKNQKNGRGSIPWKLARMPIPSSDIHRYKECKGVWSSKLSDKFLQQEISRREKLDYKLEIKKRERLAEQLLPLPSAIQSTQVSMAA